MMTKLNKKLAIVMPHFFFENEGGAELQSYYLARELVLNGWTVDYIREVSLARVVDDRYGGINLHGILIPPFLRHPRLLFLKQLMRRIQLNRVLSRIQPDFIYVRADESYLPIIDRQLDRLEAQLIWACSHEDKLKRDHWKIKYGRSLSKKIVTALIRCSLIILQSEQQKALLFQNFGIRGEVMYNAHPIPVNDRHEKRNRVLWVGRLHKRKFPERFIEIVKTLCNRKDIEFIMVGRRLDERYDRLISRAEAEFKNFRFIENASQETIYALLSSSRAIVNTSDREGFSNTFIEAWILGVPVVALGSVNPDNILTEHNIGFVCDEPSGYADKILTLIDNDDVFHEMSKNSIEVSHATFDLNKYVKSFMKLTEALLIQ